MLKSFFKITFFILILLLSGSLKADAHSGPGANGWNFDSKPADSCYSVTVNIRDSATGNLIVPDSVSIYLGEASPRSPLWGTTMAGSATINSGCISQTDPVSTINPAYDLVLVTDIKKAGYHDFWSNNFSFEDPSSPTHWIRDVYLRRDGTDHTNEHVFPVRDSSGARLYYNYSPSFIARGIPFPGATRMIAAVLSVWGPAGGGGGFPGTWDPIARTLTFTSSLTFNVDGDYMWGAFLIDNLGYTTSYPWQSDFGIDKTPPTVSCTNSLTGNDIRVNISATDATSGVGEGILEYSEGVSSSGPWSPYIRYGGNVTSSITFTGSPGMWYRFQYKARDNSYNAAGIQDQWSPSSGAQTCGAPTKVPDAPKVTAHFIVVPSDPGPGNCSALTPGLHTNGASFRITDGPNTYPGTPISTGVVTFSPPIGPSYTASVAIPPAMGLILVRNSTGGTGNSIPGLDVSESPIIAFCAVAKPKITVKVVEVATPVAVCNTSTPGTLTNGVGITVPGVGTGSTGSTSPGIIEFSDVTPSTYSVTASLPPALGLVMDRNSSNDTPPNIVSGLSVNSDTAITFCAVAIPKITVKVIKVPSPVAVCSVLTPGTAVDGINVSIARGAYLHNGVTGVLVPGVVDLLAPIGTNYSVTAIINPALNIVLNRNSSGGTTNTISGLDIVGDTSVAFCVMDAPVDPWFQTDTGDVRFNKLENEIPSGKKGSLGVPLGLNPGIFHTSKNAAAWGSDGAAGASQLGWFVDREYSYNDKVKVKNGTFSYTFFKSKARKDGIRHDVISVMPFQSIDEAVLIGDLATPDAIIEYNNSIYLGNSGTPLNIPAGKKAVVLVNGSVDILSEIKVPSNSLFILAVTGDIHIRKGVGVLSPSDSSPNLEGFYSAENSIEIQGYNDCLVNTDKRLNIEGALIANADKPFADGSGGQVIRNRDLCAGNDNPSLFVKTGVRFLPLLTDFYKTTYTKWQEEKP